MTVITPSLPQIRSIVPRLLAHWPNTTQSAGAGSVAGRIPLRPSKSANPPVRGSPEPVSCISAIMLLPFVVTIVNVRSAARRNPSADRQSVRWLRHHSCSDGRWTSQPSTSERYCFSRATNSIVASFGFCPIGWILLPASR
jgi:hypothetical protein